MGVHILSDTGLCACVCCVSGEDLQDVPVIVADVSAQESLDKMCQKARLVLNCVGPYALYGEPVVRACVENRTHHVDISGEVYVSALL